MNKKPPQQLPFISLEERTQPRLKYVNTDIEALSGDRFVARVELEQNPGSTSIGAVEGKGAGMERVRSAGLAAVKALRTAIGVDQDKFQFLDLGTVRVFDTPAIVVSLAAHIDGDLQHMVGFCVVEDEFPARAAALAVLNGANRFLGAVEVGSGRFHWKFPRGAR